MPVRRGRLRDRVCGARCNLPAGAAIQARVRASAHLTPERFLHVRPRVPVCVRRVAAAAVLGLAAAPAAAAQDASGGTAAVLAAPAHRAAARHAGAWMRAYLAQSRVPGAAVAVVAGGDVVWSEGFGLADVEHRVPVTRRTRFRLGSVSKLLAAAAAAKLAEAGRLDLDAPIQQYVPTFPARPGPPVTARLLAGHLGGVRSYRAGDFGPGRNIDLTLLPDDRVGAGHLQRRLARRPARECVPLLDLRLTLLGAAVECAAGEPYSAALVRYVLAPLGLRHTVPDRWDALIPDRTRFYGYAGPDAAPVHEAPVFASYKWAGGGMLATADDLARFGAAHLAPASSRMPACGPWSRRSARRAAAPRGGASTGVGLGWRVGVDLAGAGRIPPRGHHRGRPRGAPGLPGRGRGRGAPHEPHGGGQLARTDGRAPRHTVLARGRGGRAGCRARRGAGRGVAAPAAVRERARRAGLPMPDRSARARDRGGRPPRRRTRARRASHGGGVAARVARAAFGARWGVRRWGVRRRGGRRRGARRGSRGAAAAAP
jgi:CubicO group peptidase (beta-lactamase class C family)